MGGGSINICNDNPLNSSQMPPFFARKQGTHLETSQLNCRCHVRPHSIGDLHRVYQRLLCALQGDLHTKPSGAGECRQGQVLQSRTTQSNIIFCGFAPDSLLQYLGLVFRCAYLACWYQVTWMRVRVCAQLINFFCMNMFWANMVRALPWQLVTGRLS
jgi:hypothetical protein